MFNLYSTRNPRNPPFEALCADVRQHILSFLGFNMRAHLSDVEFANPGESARPKTNRNKLTNVWQTPTAASKESREKFPWLCSMDRVYSKDSVDLLNVQLVCRSWAADFQETVLECDGIMLHRAFLMRRNLKLFWSTLLQHNQQLVGYLKKCVSLSVANGGNAKAVSRQLQDSRPSQPPMVCPSQVENVLHMTLPVSVALEEIIERTENHPAYMDSASLSPVATCMSLIEDFTFKAKKKLAGLKARELQVLACCGKPRQLLIDALMPVALALLKKKKDGTDIEICSPTSPDARVKLLRLQNKPIPEDLQFEIEDNEEMWFMDWEQIKLIFATPHYLILDLQMRGKLDLLVSTWSRDRIASLGRNHKKNHNFTVSQVSAVSPAAGIMYEWFLDLVEVNSRLIEYGASRFQLDASAATAALRQKRRLADAAADNVYRAEVNNLINSDIVPFNSAVIFSSLETHQRHSIRAEEWESWNELVKRIPEAPFHTMKSKKFATIKNLKSANRKPSVATSSSVSMPTLGPRMPGMGKRAKSTPRLSLKM